MSWKIRHEGSPRSLEGLELQQVVEGIQEGLWEPTDEVMGPQEQRWTAIESHPQFAELAADWGPPPPRHYDDETRLDMNPLIDVTLVLLIFFILTTSYALLQNVLPAPGVTSQGPEGVPVFTPEKVQEFTIKVELGLENGKPVIRVEDQVVEPAKLVSVLSRYVQPGKAEVRLIVADRKKVPMNLVAKVQDAAQGAGVRRVLFVKEINAPPTPARQGP